MSDDRTFFGVQMDGTLLTVAESVMASRPRDFRVGPDHEPYLERWWLKREPEGSIYVHRFLRSDDDRALHDHPWDSVSIVLAGRYVEVTPEGSIPRLAGDVIFRRASDPHRIEIAQGETAITLFITGAREREWGFHCGDDTPAGGWRHWREFTKPGDIGGIGRGCE